MSLSPAEIEAVAVQMGRRPRGLVGVAARCPAGHPAAVTSYPLRRRGDRLSPFPTLYWLTCPRLARQVARLEQHGAVTELERLIAADGNLRAELMRDHERYIAQRWECLTPEDRELIVARGLSKEFHARGIGGLLSRTSVKCLHLHLAHELACGNVVGRMLIERFGVTTCPAGSKDAMTTGGSRV